MKKIILIFTIAVGILILFNGNTSGLISEKEVNNLVHNNHIKMLNTDNGWYFYPPLPNYAPSGIPDFDQKQRGWRDHENYYTFCGPVALADVLWYIDSMYSDYNGTPGDGKDECYLVRNYFSPGESTPGPNSDDHNINNVNDLETIWNQGQLLFGNELIEKLAWYCDTNGCRTGRISIGTTSDQLYNGLITWLKDLNLESYFNVEIYDIGLPYPDPINLPYDHYIDYNVTFGRVASRVKNGEFAILVIHSYGKNGEFLSGHWIPVVGINTHTSEIAVSDPYYNINNRINGTPMAHNDAAIVSHDIYNVNNTKPSFELEDFASTPIYHKTLVNGILYISTKIEPPQPPLSMEIDIKKPEQGNLYLKNQLINLETLGRTIIVGPISVEVHAYSVNGLKKVEFYLDGKLVKTDDSTSTSYRWLWDNWNFFKHTLKVVAYDNNGDSIDTEIEILKFF